MRRIACCGLLLAFLAGCAQPPPAPVRDLTRVIPSAGALARADVPPESGRHLVEAGDTLYSIAFRNRLDWRQLARWNGIAAPYTILPGQELRLEPPPEQGSATVATYGIGEQPAEAAAVAAPVLEEASPAKPTDPPAAPVPVPVVVPEPAVPEPVVAQPAPGPEPVAAPPASPASAARPSRTVAGIAWQWPADGPVLSTYAANDPTRQGLDLGGRRGGPVRATADGVVVYSGSGLVGYGELVIIKHSDTYLSAYGHNDARLVREGERVRAGQDIATMGSSGTSRVELHFEIRRQGQPIDPAGFLPPR